MLPIAAAAALIGMLSGCDAKPEGAPVIGHAYAGPATLILHQEIESKSPAVTTVRHGDKLEIIGQRRRWYKVRAANGMEGWTSDRELLDTAQMKRLKALAAETAGMPSQGVATTFATLNVHTEPSRQSPSFVQVKEHEKADVIAHKVTPRTGTTEKRELIPPKPPPAKKQEKPSKFPEPPTPAAPGPPPDWRELSKQGEPPPDVSETPRGPMDDWTLVRTESGQSGWVLTSGLYLTIPDEVAQYAEGHRITSYFSVGKIQDGDIKKDIWLWTTADSLGEDYDFDSYRVFTWSLRHHRYETAYIQRRERGFFPVQAKIGAFSVCLERNDGSRVRKNYEMLGNAVRPAGENPCDKTSEQATEPQNLVTEHATDSQMAKKSLVQRLKDKAKGLFGK
ncbi:MAG TPA: SH3 domain-containing protein [Bryobacteraceae bacterium]|nr:SH3 domain-containing protein [Bryobacteraceae bacterium]